MTDMPHCQYVLATELSSPVIAQYGYMPTCQRVLVHGSWRMFIETGANVTQSAVKEWELGIIRAMFLPSGVVQQADILVSELPANALTRMEQYLAPVHRYNRPFYEQAAVIGDDYHYRQWGRFGVTVAADADPETVLSRVDAHSYSYHLRSAGRPVLLVDRNSSMVSLLLRDLELMQATRKLIDKNYFYKLLFRDRQHADKVSLPGAVLIEQLPAEVLALLAQTPAQHVLSRFADMLESEQFLYQPILLSFDRTVKYFIKAVGGGSGNAVEASIARFDCGNPLAGEQFLRIVRNLQQRQLNPDAHQGLQLLEPVPTGDIPLGGNPADATVYQSPCVTLRVQHDPSFDWQLGQVAEQVLVDGISYGGSYWRRSAQHHFLRNIGGMAPLERLARDLAREGYTGFIGTDLIRRSDGRYAWVVDCNPRMNGNDVSYFVRHSAEQAGWTINSTALTQRTAEGLSWPQWAEYVQAYFGPYALRRQGKHLCGAVLVPKFDIPTLHGTAAHHRVGVVYLNPDVDRHRFDAFWQATQS